MTEDKLQHGGVRAGSGRKPGSSNKPKITDSMSKEDIELIVGKALEKAQEGDVNMMRFLLEQYWGNSLRDKMDYLYKSGRRFPASDNLITALVVTIDSKGQIVNVFLKNTSGIRELDEAAIESFNRAGPFPNPPKGMIRKNGTAKIEWGFVVKA